LITVEVKLPGAPPLKDKVSGVGGNSDARCQVSGVRKEKSEAEN
jgi:hypothetical protein